MGLTLKYILVSNYHFRMKYRDKIFYVNFHKLLNYGSAIIDWTVIKLWSRFISCSGVECSRQHNGRSFWKFSVLWTKWQTRNVEDENMRFVAVSVMLSIIYKKRKPWFYVVSSLCVVYWRSFWPIRPSQLDSYFLSTSRSTDMVF